MVILNMNVSLAESIVDPTLPANYKGEATNIHDSNIRMIKQNINGKSEVLIGSQNFKLGDKFGCDSFQITEIGLEQITVNCLKDGQSVVIALYSSIVKTASNASKEKKNVN